MGMTVRELIQLCLEAYSLDDTVYVLDVDELDSSRLLKVDTNAYTWGFVIGRVDL